jgi:flagellar hook-length control protein FliK
LKTGAAISDGGSFRDVLCAKVVGQGQARATASGTKPEVGGSRDQSNVKARENPGDQNASTVSLRDSKTRAPGDSDKGDSLYVSVTSPSALPVSSIAPVAEEASAPPGSGRPLNQLAMALSDNVGFTKAKASGDFPIDEMATVPTAAPAENSGVVMNAPAPSIAATSPSQAANQFQFHSDATTEEATPSPTCDQGVPPRSTPDQDPAMLLVPFPGDAVPANRPSLLDALVHPASLQQKTDGSDRSPLVAPAHTPTLERRDVPPQNQPTNGNDTGSGNTAAGLTAASAASASRAETIANILPNSNIPTSTAAPQSLNSARKANSEEPAWAGRKEDHSPSRFSQPEIDAQPESQAAPLKAGEPDLTMRTGEISPAAFAMGHNPNADSTAVTAAPGGLEVGGLQTSHASSDGQPTGNTKATLTPDPTSNAADMTSAATPVLQSARVLERMGQSEIRVGLNTANFGNLELRTTVNQDRVAATLATSHSELRAALAAEMPSLEHAMAQRQLTLDSFHLDTRSGPHNGNHGAAGDQQNRSQTWTGTAAELGAAGDGSPMPEMASQLWIGPDSSGLNVHA